MRGRLTEATEGVAIYEARVTVVHSFPRPDLVDLVIGILHLLSSEC